MAVVAAGVAWRLVATMISLAMTGCATISPPLSASQVESFAAELSAELEPARNEFVGLLTVDAAVKRAMRFNHAIRAKELEVALVEAKVLAQGGAMLPNIVAESDSYRRNRPHMSHSNQSPSFSTSTDLRTLSRDIALSWNVLDFGLSLVRARQGLDKALQQHEETGRVRARIVEETRSVYWRAVALERLGSAVSRLDREVNSAVALSRAASRDQKIDPMVPINYQRDILNSQRELNLLQVSLAGATDQLKQSIGLPHIEQIRLDDTRHVLTLPVSSAADDVAIALRQRPEIRQHLYDLRITEDEVNATLLQLLPGVTLSKTFASDSNSYLQHSNWISWGTKVAGNLIHLVRLPADLDAIDAQQRVHRQNALATAATIAMQVHVARARMAVQMRAYRDAGRFAEVQRQLLYQVRTSVELNKVGRQALAREKLATLLAEIRAIVAFAELHAAFAAYATARGDAPIEDPIVVANRRL